MSNRLNTERGFTLLELMIALFVGAVLILISYNVLTSQKRAGDAQNQTVSAQQNARVALETLERELRLAGLDIDDFDKQPIFIDAAPYQVIFDADVSGDVNGVPSMSRTQSVALHDGTRYSPGAYPGENLGTQDRYSNGAETIRFTLDRNGDGIVNADDRYTETQNPSDYALYREENGSRIDMVAFGLRGRENYPDGQLPQPLFKYYGDFNGTGAVLLWGDGNGDGQLSQTEIAALTAVPQNRLSKIVDVEVSVEAESPNMEASYVGPHSTGAFERNYRSVVMTSKIRPRNVGTGSANLHACGNPPGAPAGLAGVDLPRDAGESIKLTFNKSADETGGEKDVKTYTVYRRLADQIGRAHV
jgi:prepilin-type N-terminal cleavage/methylation domain-containing protein